MTYKEQPATYGHHGAVNLVLKTARKAHAIGLFEQHNDRTDQLIFTYGATPRCYAAGCSLAGQ